MKNLMINKFNVRFNGTRYSKGDIIKNVPDEIAEKLIAESNGTIIEIASIEVEPPKSETGAGQPPNLNPEGDPDAENSPKKKELEADATQLPTIDPKATVKSK